MAHAKLPNGLTRKQETFCLEFFRNEGNATAAYHTAYSTKNMNPKTVNEAASRLLHDSKVAARLEELRRNVASQVEIREADILTSAARAMLADPRKMLDEDGNILELADWPDDIALAVDSFEIQQLPGKRGSLHKVKFSPRAIARDQLMKFAGLYEKDNAQRASGLLARLDDLPDEVLDALEERVQAVIDDADPRTLN
jgi:hypothetical protein